MSDEKTGPTPDETLAQSDEVTPGTESDATDNAPENALPVEPEQLQPEVVGVRRGMFGVEGSGDTSGYGGLTRPVVMPGGTVRPYGGWFDDFADSLDTGLADRDLTTALEKVVVHRGEITLFVRRGLARADVGRDHLGGVADEEHVAERQAPTEVRGGVEMVGHLLDVVERDAGG